eukprot:4118121-Alexandrium_andersonii.AAC.1
MPNNDHRCRPDLPRAAAAPYVAQHPPGCPRSRRVTPAWTRGWGCARRGPCGRPPDPGGGGEG